jgi:hypothetical protein
MRPISPLLGCRVLCVPQGLAASPVGPDMTLVLGLWYALPATLSLLVFPSTSQKGPLIPQPRCKDALIYVSRHSAQGVCCPVAGEGGAWRGTALACSSPALSTPSTWSVHLAQETGSLLGRCLSRGTQKASRMSSLGLWGLNLGWSLFAPLPCASLPTLEEG